jgi:hypothetical protein
MTIVIVSIVIFIVVLFLLDKRRAQNSVEATGGLEAKFPAFIQWVDMKNLSISGRKMTQTKLSNSVIEYRMELFDSESKKTKGQIYFTFTHVFATTVGCRIELLNGYKHKGYIKEIDEIGAMSMGTFETVFNSILNKILTSSDFQNNYESF